jgi:hypothetical protein
MENVRRAAVLLAEEERGTSTRCARIRAFGAIVDAR